jgi:hypothetical protein
MDVKLSDVIAILALVSSAYAIWTTSRFNRRQLSLIETQEKLNKRTLAQSESEALDARKADVGASLVRYGGNNYRVKVFNKGKSPARNVVIEFPDGNNMVPDSEIRDKFPMELLEQHQSVDLIAAVSMDTPSKQPVVLKWSDDNSDNNKKTSYLTH